MRDISEGMCWLERTFHQHMSKISGQREQIENNINFGRSEQAATLEALEEEYREKVKTEERLYEQFLTDSETACAQLGEEEERFTQRYRFQMAQHESAQVNLATKLTTARGAYGQSYNLDAPPPPPLTSSVSIPRAPVEMDPTSQQATDHALGISMASDIPLATVQYVLQQDFLKRHAQAAAPAPATPHTRMPTSSCSTDGSSLHVCAAVTKVANTRTFMEINPPTPNSLDAGTTSTSNSTPRGAAPPQPVSTTLATPHTGATPPPSPEAEPVPTTPATTIGESEDEPMASHTDGTTDNNDTDQPAAKYRRTLERRASQEGYPVHMQSCVGDDTKTLQAKDDLRHSHDLWVQQQQQRQQQQNQTPHTAQATTAATVASSSTPSTIPTSTVLPNVHKYDNKQQKKAAQRLAERPTR